MKKIISLVATLLMSLSFYAQAQSIPASVYVDENISDDARNSLTSLLRSVLTVNGIDSNNDYQRIILFARADVTQNSIVPSTPPKVSKKVTIHLVIGDAYENQIFSTCSLDLTGIGPTDTKAFVKAFSTIKPASTTIQNFLSNAKTKMENYYAANNNSIISRSEMIVKSKEYDRAINYLLSVPCFSASAAETYREAALEIYKKKVEDTSRDAYMLAMAEWTRNRNEDGASAALEYIKQVDPASTAYSGALKLWDEISSKLSKDEQDAKDFANRQYKDEQAFKSSILKTIEKVGTAYGNNRPKEVTKIISGWWF